jgi:hypothetical protein
VVGEGDDKGLICTEQWSVGSPDSPKESVFGGGDSYSVPIAFHFDYANLIGNVLTGAMDVSAILQSDSASTTGLFGGTVAGSALLVGSLYPYGGTKTKIDTLGSIDPDNIQAEYLRDNTPSWINTPYMVTDADFPYSQKGNRIATCSSCSEQWRFGFDPDNLPTQWDKVTLNINGVNYEYYWSLVRVTAPIITDATIEQIKLHTNRFEINADGSTEYFGRSRYPKTLIAGLQNITPNTAANPANENVSYGPGITAGYVENEFANGANDGFILVQNIEEGLDTSIPLELSVSYYVKGTSIGDINLHLDLIDVSDGFTYNGLATPLSIENAIDTISVNSDEVRRTTKIKFPINKLDTNSGVLIHLHRDASAGNPLDTLPANIIITNVRLTGYFWRP